MRLFLLKILTKIISIYIITANIIISPIIIVWKIKDYFKSWITCIQELNN